MLPPLVRRELEGGPLAAGQAPPNHPPAALAAAALRLTPLRSFSRPRPWGPEERAGAGAGVPSSSGEGAGVLLPPPQWQVLLLLAGGVGHPRPPAAGTRTMAAVLAGVAEAEARLDTAGRCPGRAGRHRPEAALAAALLRLLRLLPPTWVSSPWSMGSARSTGRRAGGCQESCASPGRHRPRRPRRRGGALPPPRLPTTAALGLAPDPPSLEAAARRSGRARRVGASAAASDWNRAGDHRERTRTRPGR